jgi:hypothetical protein
LQDPKYKNNLIWYRYTVIQYSENADTLIIKYKLNYSGNSLQPLSRNTNIWQDSTHTEMEFKQTGCGWYGNEFLD